MRFIYGHLIASIIALLYAVPIWNWVVLGFCVSVMEWTHVRDLFLQRIEQCRGISLHGWLCIKSAFGRVALALRKANHWAWGITTAGRRERRIASLVAECHNPPHRAGVAKASWDILNETVVACRAQLGLDRYSSHSDPATRQLVSKTCIGILTDTTRFPTLRRSDAEKLSVIAREMALTPVPEELLALNVVSSEPYARNRSLARGAWGAYPTTWFQWLCQCLGVGTGEVYLPPVPPPTF